MLAALLANVFSKAGFAVVSAHDGEDGLMKAFAHRPDMTLLDIMLPKKDGVTLFEELRRHDEWGKTAKVIFFTNIGDEVTAQQFATDPHCDYVMKCDLEIRHLVEYVTGRLPGASIAGATAA